MPRRHSGRVVARPAMNVTPLVDVVLVLLILFMLVVPPSEQGPRVRLPELAHSDAEAGGQVAPLVVSVTYAGEIWFQRSRLRPEELAASLQQAAAQKPVQRLVLEADREAGYRAVRQVFAVCEQAGFKEVDMRVRATRGPR